MLRSRISCALQPRRLVSYFSAEFNKLVNEGPAKFASSSSHAVTNIDLDLFVNPENRPMDVVDRLLKLRKQKEASMVPLLPSVLVKQLLDSTNPQEAISVLRNPTQYGLFVDQFSGCFLLDFLLHNGHAVESAQMATILVDRSLCNNELVESLALQAFWSFAQDFKPFESSTIEPPAKNAEVVKVRVKFLRNYPEDASENTEEKKLGRAMIRLGSGEGSLKELKQNIGLLGYVLSGQVAEASSFLTKNQAALHKETLSAAQAIAESLKLEGSEELMKLLQETLEKSTKSNAIQGLLEKSVRDTAHKFEPKLLAEYGESYQEWAKKFESAIQCHLEAQSLEQRKSSIQKTLTELEAKRQNLWFFENRDDIDIQIYKKKVYYPKRWFGKKKKPKAADTFYVPPNITHNA
ncbi:uncharacterized protein LOC128254079 [Drosophila gunungcola]|uniref:Mitochondrial 28S ribosomal protein S27 n=1 Tax=Drosophila gunungcola TaxID=103775 RepID=A0A9Q0BQ90_9MUSC|nr:uncharacterized protein LOC128254079 [Drosophila gunungcola]KAI8039814.1 hypothetical protein M5D96_007238 [Drosophila gunungcola]